MEQFPCTSPQFAQDFKHNQPISNPKTSSLCSNQKIRHEYPSTLMRCRIKDLISCFNACKFPIENDIDDDDLDHQRPKASSTIDDWNSEREKQVKLRTKVEKGGGEDSPASWQSCEPEEDDYIVFYFKDDDDGGSVIEERCSDRSPRSEVDAADANRRKKRHETDKIRADVKLVPLEIEDPNESDEHKDTLGGSSDSSTSSFAFPPIQREWTGSPVLMPRPEGHNKSRSVHIQCCKF